MRCSHFHLLCCLGFTLFCLSVCHLWAEAPTHPKIVFNSTRDGNTEIYVMDPEPQLHMFRPAWSLDGTTIAFSHVEKLGGRGPVTGTIYTVRRDGANLREIIPEQEPISEHPAWSPSAEELAYHRKVGENWQIFKIDLASRQSKQLTNRGINVYPDWFDPAFALPVSPKPQLLTTVWAKMKASN